MYKCPTCGAGLVFDPKSQQLLCLSCRNKYDPENAQNMIADKAVEYVDSNNYEAISYKCRHCGAELITTDETITTFCSFCRTGEMLERKIIKKTKPDYIIPFSITKEECEQIYRDKISNAFLAPKSMIDTQEVSKIRGIYMPYWIYSFEKHGRFVAPGEKYIKSVGNKIYYDTYSLETDIDAVCKGITHDATLNYWDKLSEAIAPFSVKEKKTFSPAYLSGFYADNEDVGADIYIHECREIAGEEIDNRLYREKEFTEYDATPHIELNEENYELGLFPVYYLATKNKKGDRIGYAVINGQTGKIAADIPIDFKKLIFISIGLAIPIFAILNFWITFNVVTLTFVSIIFSIISTYILNKTKNNIEAQEIENEEERVRHKKGKSSFERKVKKKFGLHRKVDMSRAYKYLLIARAIVPILTLTNRMGERIWGIVGVILIIADWYIKKFRLHKSYKHIYKPTFGALISFLVIALQPVNDIYYYIAALISIWLSIWSFADIINQFNILTTIKLPGLNKRGGDENA